MAAAGRFERFCQLLTTRGFVTRKISEDGRNGLYKFGPAGVLLKHNIYDSWWHWMVSTQDSSFPVEETSCLTPDKNETANNGALSFFTEISEIMNKKLPFSIVHVSKTTTDSSQIKMLLDCCTSTHLMLLHACTPSSSDRTLDHWLRYRLRWWKQFAANPSHFSINREKNSAESGTRIQYDFPWGLETIETITNKGDNPFQAQDEFKVDSKSVLPHLIECSTTLESSMMTFLSDAYTEKEIIMKKKPASTRVVMQLHPALASYKVAMVISSQTRELQEVASHIAKELRSVKIQILHTDDVQGLEKHYNRNDELGIPFTVVVNEATLESGLVEIRDRDTTLKEQVAISKLFETVQKNIKSTL